MALQGQKIEPVGSLISHSEIQRQAVGENAGFFSVALGGIELMHMIAKGQMTSDGGRHRSVAEQFYDLAK